MKKIYDITGTFRDYPDTLFNYPCVDPNTAFLTDKNVFVFENSATEFGQCLVTACRNKGANVCDSLNCDIDILVLNTPFLRTDEIVQSGKAYFDILFYYIKPVQQVLPVMLKKKWGQIVFVLPPQALEPSVEYTGNAAFAVGGMVKGLALEYARKGIVVNGVVLGESPDFDTAAEWVLFLASGNARHIVGELVNLTADTII
jgi:NAD(P)-dependent dehydrogenase (short-subunit alcohol dehydrogenase family)